MTVTNLCRAGRFFAYSNEMISTIANYLAVVEKCTTLNFFLYFSANQVLFHLPRNRPSSKFYLNSVLNHPLILKIRSYFLFYQVSHVWMTSCKFYATTKIIFFKRKSLNGVIILTKKWNLHRIHLKFAPDKTKNIERDRNRGI